ncbi:MAG: transcriptional regulator [Acidithiobacillus ferriphilus]|jgi:DNA-binding HxlR family transcriptional regulator|nr:transcriptional regulator [Acidithiobacillus ferriphilus]
MDQLLRLLMGPWTTYILWVLENQGTLRFGELKRTIPGISSRMLTERLRGLETAQIVFRDYRPTIPPEVRYGLTERGQELGTVLASLNLLAQRWFLEKNDRITNNALFYSADSWARLNLYRAAFIYKRKITFASVLVNMFII